MATSDDALETYTHLPVHIDPQTKAVSITSSDQSLQDAINSVNALHTAFKSLEAPNTVPPPPLSVTPKRSAQINKLRESAGVSVRKGQLPEAIRMLGFAIDMAHSRPAWEPVGLVKEELATCYMSRANVHVLAQNWVEGLKDAECSTECKKGPQQGPNGEKGPGNSRAWTIGAKCLVEMGRWPEVIAWGEKAIEVGDDEGDDGRELHRLMRVAQSSLQKR